MDIVYSDSLSESGTLLFFGPVGDGMLFLERSFAIPRAQFRPPFGASIAQSLLVIEPHELPTTIRATGNHLLFLSQDRPAIRIKMQEVWLLPSGYFFDSFRFIFDFLLVRQNRANNRLINIHIWSPSL
jgi:hypothetical protein